MLKPKLQYKAYILIHLTHFCLGLRDLVFVAQYTCLKTVGICYFLTMKDPINDHCSISRICHHRCVVKSCLFQHCSNDKHVYTSIGTTRPIPPNRRSCLGWIRWKDMSNPNRLRWNIVLTETYESHSTITNQSEHLEQRAIGTTRPIPPNRRSCKV